MSGILSSQISLPAKRGTSLISCHHQAVLKMTLSDGNGVSIKL